jgi:hypothetical protein
MPRELIPIVLFIMSGAVAIAYSPIGAAIARRINGPRVDPTEMDELRGEMNEMRSELDEMRGRVGQVDELQERVDFAERLLAQARSQGVLPDGGTR